MSLGFSLEHPDYEDPLFARVKVDARLPQWILLPQCQPEQSYRFLNMRELILHHSDVLFPKMKHRIQHW